MPTKQSELNKRCIEKKRARQDFMLYKLSKYVLEELKICEGLERRLNIIKKNHGEIDDFDKLTKNIDFHLKHAKRDLEIVYESHNFDFIERAKNHQQKARVAINTLDNDLSQISESANNANNLER